MTQEAIPGDDEWFDLEVDHTQDPMDVIVSARQIKEGWRYRGPEFNKDMQAYRATIILLGAVRNLEEARQKADGIGYRLVEGQAWGWFRQNYSFSDYGIVIFGGSQWESPDHSLKVACLEGGVEGEWHLGFYSSAYAFNDLCLWVVVLKETPSP